MLRWASLAALLKCRRGTVSGTLYPFAVDDDDDHCETSPEAYRDVDAILGRLADLLGKTREELAIYDPYYCTGQVVKHLGEESPPPSGLVGSPLQLSGVFCPDSPCMRSSGDDLAISSASLTANELKCPPGQMLSHPVDILSHFWYRSLHCEVS